MVRESPKDTPNLNVKVGARLSNRKWYNYIVHTQLFVFAAMHLILGLYLAFVSTKYANKTVYTAKLDEHQKLDQIFAIACFLLIGVALNIHSKMKKNKKIPVLYYIYMGVSAALPLVYLLLSSMFVNNAVNECLHELITSGECNSEYVVYYTGIELGIWTPADLVSYDTIGKYLSNIGEELYTLVKIDNVDVGGIVRQMRAEMYNWNKFELYSVINLGVSVVLLVCGIFIPRQKKVKAVEEVLIADNEDVAACEQ